MFPRHVKLVLLVALLALPARAQDDPKKAEKTEEKKPKVTLADFEDAFLEVAEKVRPGVVAIEVRHGGDEKLNRDVLFSGVVWDAEGTIVALGRDLESASEILVSPFEGEPVKARFVGVDDETGLCVLKLDSVPAKGLTALEHGPVDKLRAGSFCIAVGNPVGLRHSVAFGHVAATNRTVRRGNVVTKDALQVTLPVNPGDAGGLLADSRGRLVGVLSSALRRADPGSSFDMNQLRRLMKQFERGAGGEKGGPTPEDLERGARALQRAIEPNMSQLFTQNVSFAIPVDTVAKAVDRVKSNRGKPWLGVDVKDLSSEDREELGVPADKGVIIIGVAPGSPAARANLRASDVIVSWNNEVVKSSQALRRIVLGTAVGTKVTLEVVREEKTTKLEVTVEGRGESLVKPSEEKKKP